MLSESIDRRLKKICPAAESVDGAGCAFAPSGALGFIDTSGTRSGSRGIAFFDDRMFVNTDGTVCEVAYKNIGSTHIISSFEDSFADELSVVGNDLSLRISDYSLDKFELKRLLDELCRESEQSSERREAQAEKYAERVAKKLADEAPAGHSSPITETVPAAVRAVRDEPPVSESERPFIAETVIDIPETRAPLPEGYAPAPIPEEKIDWLSGTYSKPTSAGIFDTIGELPEESAPEAPSPKTPEIMNGVVDRAPIIGTPSSKPTEHSPETPEQEKATPEKNTAAQEPSESKIREQLENMPREEIMRFLSDTLNEINTPFFEQTDEPRSDYGTVKQTVPDIPAEGETSSEAASAPPEAPPSKWAKLTEEPIWGDIYIKASRNLRELCESGKLSMEQMEAELKEHLLAAAEAFERITDNESKVPKKMIPKITELKAAAENFDQYFNYGEDIAVRAMFFMLYQMLTYADRIAETPETKDNLNDFFRRFGPAGITLSMLDMRV